MSIEHIDECVRMRKMDMQEMVGGELPAHMWIAIWTWYQNLEDQNHFMVHLIEQVQRKIVAPEYMEKQEKKFEKAEQERSQMAELTRNEMSGLGAMLMQGRGTAPDTDSVPETGGYL